MRRKYLGIAIAALATLGPMQAWGGDREIAEQIIQRLKTNRDSGALKDFTLDMKVDQGVVLFRGNVSESVQKDLVLGSAAGIEGIAKIVDEVSVTTVAAAPVAAVVKPKASIAKVIQTEAKNEIAAASAPMQDASKQVASKQDASTQDTATQDPGFSLREALAAQAKVIAPIHVVPGVVQPASAVEPASAETPSDDTAVVDAVVSALGRAKDAGKLKGFGVDVKSNGGVLQLTGRAASEAQRTEILRIVEMVPGVEAIRESISVPTQGLAQLPASALAPANNVPAQFASAPMNVQSMPMQQQNMQQMQMQQQAMTAPYRMQQQQTQAMQAGMGYGGGMNAPVMGQPVPMAPAAPAGAPRYDSPNLPNYAWPGYAAHPNYAAVTYPQQYSPSAWPYIGPFYPYPQVPLGWRKVSLEWDDGWWFLDFTDR